MRNKQMPNHRLESLRVWRDRFAVDRWYDHASICYLRGIATVASDNTGHLRADGLGQLQRRDQIRADVLLQIAASDGKYEYRIFRLQLADLEPLDEHTRPTLVVRACGQFGHVVRRRVGFDADNLAKVVHRMRAVASTASDAKE